MSIAQLGRFEITGTLGRGAMGTVYRAHDPLIDRTVAIKTVGCTGLSRQEAEDFERRFFIEAKSAGRLNHPNIVTIHDVGRSGDLAYIAMEFLTGRSLRELLDSGVVLPAERCAEIAAAVADGLAFAHANGVVHRDIKPANIMVLDNGAVKIADFGVALIPSGSLTVSGTAFGSPKYMSPEQVTGQKADGRSDIFSLGVVLYEMLVGRPPFNGDDLNAILYQVLNGAPPLPSTFNPALPHGFDRVVAHALAKNPDKRFQTAAELAVALRKCRRLAKVAKRNQEAEAAQQRAAHPGDATVPLKTVTAEVASRPAWYKTGWLYALPLLAMLSLGAWWLQQEADETPSPTSNVSSSTPEPTAVLAVPPAPISAPAATPVAATPVPVAEPAMASVPEVPAATSPAKSEGRIRLAISPWGEVYVDGKKAGVTPPLAEIHLPTGKHNIEIRNGNFRPHRLNVDVAMDANLRIKHKFE
jgi:serine/threonine-protein kinase